MADRLDAAAHAAHDLLLVAALADRELTGPEHDRARAQVDACSECASLHAELLSLARATHALPPISRPRDFTLRPEDAQRLRPNLLRRILGSFGTARDGFSRPLAMGLTTLGLAGILVGAVPGALSQAGAGASPDAAQREMAPATDTLIQMAGGSPVPDSTAGSAPGTTGTDASDEDVIAGPVPPVALGGTVLLIAGLGIGAARLVAGRDRGNHRGAHPV